ncbi:MAG TPA: putative geopeptide radical SAM maturase [Desulfuromonadales bacterium]|nr:putative geopeptide radical SAM maturase [Desulfuromonadales bacterium]
MPLSRYMKIYPDRPGYVLLYSTRKGSVVRVPEEFLATARDGSLSESDRGTLRRLELWVDDPLAEREAMIHLIDQTNSCSGKFMATVVLTLDCNLACPYCFEDHFRGAHAMSEETARLLVEYIMREQIQHGRDVELRFYGGEPLMAIPRLKDIAGAVQEAAVSAGTEFFCSLVTNATLLTRAVVEELLPFGLRSAQITLDGPAAVHNRQRPFVSGEGSFQIIVDNLCAVCDLITLKPGGNFTRENYREFPAMFDALLEAGIDPAQLGPVQFSPVHPKSGGHDPHSASCAIGSEPWLIEAHLFLRKETLRRGFAVDKPHMGVCMIELTNNLVVNYDGSLYKCPALMGWPEYAISTLADSISDYRESHNLDVWKNDECLECAYLPLCFGGCRFFRLLKTAAINGVDCRRAMLDASLEAIVRQDLAGQGILNSQGI